MRPVRYNVAATLDGYIAGPNGEYDWIPDDPTVDFAGLFAKVDTYLIGRTTYEVARAQPQVPWSESSRVFVFSTTLADPKEQNVTIVRENAAEVVASLRAEPGDGEIWLFGGGALFKSLLAAGQVDTVEVTIAPVLLGGGIPLLPAATSKAELELTHTHRYPSGMVAVHYRVKGARPAP